MVSAHVISQKKDRKGICEMIHYGIKDIYRLEQYQDTVSVAIQRRQKYTWHLSSRKAFQCYLVHLHPRSGSDSTAPQTSNIQLAWTYPVTENHCTPSADGFHCSKSSLPTLGQSLCNGPHFATRESLDSFL